MARVFLPFLSAKLTSDQFGFGDNVKSNPQKQIDQLTDKLVFGTVEITQMILYFATFDFRIMVLVSKCVILVENLAF